MTENPRQWAVEEVLVQQRAIVRFLREYATEIERHEIDRDGPEYGCIDEFELTRRVVSSLTNLQTNVWHPINRMIGYADTAVTARRNADLQHEVDEGHELRSAVRQWARTPTGKKAREELLAAVEKLDL